MSGKKYHKCFIYVGLAILFKFFIGQLGYNGFIIRLTLCVCVCVCVRARVRACVRACVYVSACVRACVVIHRKEYHTATHTRSASDELFGVSFVRWRIVPHPIKQAQRKGVGGTTLRRRETHRGNGTKNEKADRIKSELIGGVTKRRTEINQS